MIELRFVMDFDECIAGVVIEAADEVANLIRVEQRCEQEDRARAGGDPRENARIAREILAGGNGARTEIVAANAGAALYVSGAADTIRDGVAMAREAIANGAAMAKLQELVAVTNE